MLLILLGITALVGLTLIVFNFLVPKGAGILVEADPVSSVFINGEEVGKTPYSGIKKPGEITVKLVPDSFGKPLPTYETKTTLVSGVQTVVRRKIAETEEASEGELISFERVGKKETSMALVTSPDNSQIKVDGELKGFSPLKTDDIAEAEHDLNVSANGYLDRSIQVRIVSGYKLIAYIKLAKTEEPRVEVQKTETEKKEMVKILQTPTGYLRVRKTPSTVGEEVGQVTPGETYELVETDDISGWFKIIYNEGKEGWVTNQYAEKVADGEKSG
uniref:Nonfunctional Uncharacterized protein n=1 Tax=uncultured Microgenomates bacterium Rifle_16ft_4_minimus_37633 TaxID=1665114 RepID=A0A0H4T660_9BACT